MGVGWGVVRGGALGGMERSISRHDLDGSVCDKRFLTAPNSGGPPPPTPLSLSLPSSLLEGRPTGGQLKEAHDEAPSAITDSIMPSQARQPDDVTRQRRNTERKRGEREKAQRGEQEKRKGRKK